MAEKEYTDNEITELDHFFNTELNYNSFREIIGEDNEDYKDLFEPLEFARLFKAQVELIQVCWYKPFTVSRNLQKLGLSNKQLFFLYEKLIEHFEIYDSYEGYRPQYEIICREISRLKDKLNLIPDKDSETIIPTKKFDFDRVKETLEDISNPYQQIAYLIKIKTMYLQEYNYNQESGTTFAQQCDFEIEKIDKIKKVIDLSVADEQDWNDGNNDSNETVEDGNEVRNRDLTLDQTVLFFSYLFNFAKLDCPNTKKAKVIATLTGFSENTVNQQLSVVHKKQADNPKAFAKDIKKVRSSFEQLNFRKITSIIDKDLKFY